MNQIKTLSLPPIKKPALPTPDEPDRRYQWIKLTLLDTAGEFMVAPEGGSPAADNIPQKRADATQIRQKALIARGVDPKEAGIFISESLRAAKADQQRQQAQGGQQPQLPAGPPMAPSGTPTQ
jgi:hypothetical protein